MSGATVMFPGDASITTQSLSILATVEHSSNPATVFALVQSSASQLTPTLSLTTQTALIAINNFGIPIWTVPLSGTITAAKPYLTHRDNTLFLAGLSGITAYGQISLSSPTVLIIDSTTAALTNYLTLNNITAGTVGVWVDISRVIWLLAKGSSNSPTISIGTGAPISHQTSLANKYFLVSIGSDIATTTFYSYPNSATTVLLNQGLVWDSLQTSIIPLSSSTNPVTLQAAIGAPIITGVSPGSDFILMTSTIVYKFALNGQLLWTLNASSGTTLIRMNGHRLFGSANGSSASLTVGLSSTTLTPGTWVADLDPSTGIPGNIIYGSNLTGNDERLLVATSAITGTIPSVSSPIYIYRYAKPTNTGYIASTAGSPFTFITTNFESFLACPHNTWLALAWSGNTVEMVHLDSDGTIIWRNQISQISKIYAPILHPTDNMFALLLPTGISIYNLHTGSLVSSRAVSVPSFLTSAAWVAPNQITVTTASTVMTYDLSGDQIVVTTTGVPPPSPLVWPGGISYLSDIVSYGGRNYPPMGTNVVAAMEARFNTTPIVVLLRSNISLSYNLSVLNPATETLLWTIDIQSSTTPQLSLNATNIFILFPTATIATSTIGQTRFDGATIAALDPSNGNIYWSSRITGAVSVATASGLRLLPNRLLIRTSTGITYYSPPVPSAPTAQLAVDQDSTLAGSQFISANGTRNLVIATTTATQTLQFGQAGTSKPVASLSPGSIELNAPLAINAKVTMGGGLDATSMKIFPALPSGSLIREAMTSLTMCAVSANYNVQIGSLGFPTEPFYNTGTNLAIIGARTGSAATIDFGNSIPLSAKLLEASTTTLLVSIDVQLASPLQAPVFYDSRGVRCSIATTSPSFASSLYMTYFITFNASLTPTQRLLQIEGSRRTLCMRMDTQGNYVFSGAVGTSSVPNLFVTDASGTTTSTPKGTGGTYVWKAAYGGAKTLEGTLADVTTDSAGGVYVLGATALTAYNSTGTATTLTTYSSTASAFWVSPTHAILGSNMGTISAAGFVPAAVLPAAPSAVVAAAGSTVLALTPTTVYAVCTQPYPAVLWTVTGLSNIVDAALVANTLSIAMSTSTSAVPTLTTYDGSIVSFTGDTGSAALLRITYGDLAQSMLPAVSFTSKAAAIGAPLALAAADTCSGGTIALNTPLTTLTATGTYSLGAATTPGQVKVLLAAPGVTATVSLSGRQATVSGTSGTMLIYANSTWYQL